ncbi:MAG: mitochondrial fission ELM1 family protein [Alphaproteobacteria bacterium]
MKTLWILADDRMGNVNQLLGVAEETHIPFERKDIRYTKWVRLPNLLRGASRIGLTKESAALLNAPWPDIVLSAGRRSFPIARWIKRQSGGKTKIVQLMNPGSVGFKEADIVVLPEHDRFNGTNSNVMRVSGTPHAVTPARLEVEKAYWAGRLAKYPSPRISVIVGGATKNKPFTPEMAEKLVQGVLALNPGSVLVTTSRRTPAAVTEIFKNALPRESFFYRFGDKEENPYFGLLSWADTIVVTGDSMSMCSECCGTTAPVYIFAPDDMMSAKHKRFHATLYAKGCASALGGKRTFSSVGGGFNPAKQIAEKIIALMQAHD